MRIHTCIVCGKGTAQIYNLGYEYCEPVNNNNQAEGIYRDIHSPLSCINAIS
jgi:hypothetical protein